MALRAKNGTSKSILRQVLYRYVPRELVDREKMGFGVPIEEWLRGPLRIWGEELLEPDRLREQGIFDAQVIRQTWDDHLQRRGRNHFQLWDILMFQAWMANWGP
jgi:asparagine synthase (glutamine-hydrolysing)